MVYSENQLNRLLASYIADGMDGIIGKPHYGVPEEEVLKEKPMPYMTLFYLGDELSSKDWLSGTKYLKKIGPDNAPTAYEIWEMPEATTFMYQLDIYSQSQEKMVELSTELSRVIRRRGTSIPDGDGDLIEIERSEVVDFTRDNFRLQKSQERIFRRTYTFILNCYLQPNKEPIETVGPVLATYIEFEILKENHD